MNIKVPHEVKNQHSLAKRTSQIMKNGQDVNIQMRNGTIYTCPYITISTCHSLY